MTTQTTVSTAAQEYMVQPVIRSAKGGGVLVLCPDGHLIDSIRKGDWAHSKAEARYADPGYRVACTGCKHK